MKGYGYLLCEGIFFDFQEWQEQFEFLIKASFFLDV